MNATAGFACARELEIGFDFDLRHGMIEKLEIGSERGWIRIADDDGS